MDTSDLTDLPQIKAAINASRPWWLHDKLLLYGKSLYARNHNVTRNAPITYHSNPQPKMQKDIK